MDKDFDKDNDGLLFDDEETEEIPAAEMEVHASDMPREADVVREALREAGMLSSGHRADSAAPASDYAGADTTGRDSGDWYEEDSRAQGERTGYRESYDGESYDAPESREKRKAPARRRPVRRSAEEERDMRAGDTRRQPRERRPERRQERGQQEYRQQGRRQQERRQQERRQKRHHPVRNFFLTLLILIILLPVLYVLAKFGGLHSEKFDAGSVRKFVSEEVKKSQQTGPMAGYTNIALFGLDSVSNSLDKGNNRSDVMIIASINDATGDVKLVSLYRDTYLDIGDGKYQKANAAYAYGGPDQAVSMLNRNLDLNIDDYVTVGFNGVASLIDEVGGVEIDVQPDEIEHLNNYQSTMAQELGRQYVPVQNTGLQTLNGLQATAYCRIRYTDGGDFKRTQRQKEVLSKAFAKLKAAGPVTMLKVANDMTDKIRTSLNMGEIASMAMKASRYNITETTGMPFDGMVTVGYIGDQSCVIPVHLTDNVKKLHSVLFGDENYTVSSTVQQISDHVSSVSGR